MRVTDYLESNNIRHDENLLEEFKGDFLVDFENGDWQNLYKSGQIESIAGCVSEYPFELSSKQHSILTITNKRILLGFYRAFLVDKETNNYFLAPQGLEIDWDEISILKAENSAASDLGSTGKFLTTTFNTLLTPWVQGSLDKYLDKSGKLTIQFKNGWVLILNFYEKFSFNQNYFNFASALWAGMILGRVEKTKNTTTGIIDLTQLRKTLSEAKNISIYSQVLDQFFHTRLATRLNQIGISDDDIRNFYFDLNKVINLVSPKDTENKTSNLKRSANSTKKERNKMSIKDKPASSLEANQNNSTFENITKSNITYENDIMPIFSPSKAIVPEGFKDTGKITNLKYSLFNAANTTQSFFSDLNLISSNNSVISINDQVLTLPPFDEAIYCSLVKEMHKFSIAELKDEQEEKIKLKAKYGAVAGFAMGVLTLNPLAPFIGSSIGMSYSRLFEENGKKIEEILPDPNLLFLKDNYSYLSIGRFQTPKLRRIIFAPVKTDNSMMYFRILPAIVTNESVLPMQVFKLGTDNYFLRPIVSGIDRNQTNYDAVKIHRKYFHSRIGDGISEDTGERINVTGPDIEDMSYKIYSYVSDSQNLNYYYFDYLKQPGYVY